MGRARVNQTLIAKRLKLSPATVSRSLGNGADVTPETRAKVLSAAAEMGYRGEARSGARREKAPEDAAVGVLISDYHGDDFPIRGFLKGLSEAAGRRRISLVVHAFEGDSHQIL